jgi:hypothetical protein
MVSLDCGFGRIICKRGYEANFFARRENFTLAFKLQLVPAAQRAAGKLNPNRKSLQKVRIVRSAERCSALRLRLKFLPVPPMGEAHGQHRNTFGSN